MVGFRARELRSPKRPGRLTRSLVFVFSHSDAKRHAFSVYCMRGKRSGRVLLGDSVGSLHVRHFNSISSRPGVEVKRQSNGAVSHFQGIPSRPGCGR